MLTTQLSDIAKKVEQSVSSALFTFFLITASGLAVAQGTNPGELTRTSFNPANGVLFVPCIELSGGGDLDGFWQIPFQVNLDGTISIIVDDQFQYFGSQRPDGCRNDFLILSSNENGALTGATYKSYNTAVLPDIAPDGTLNEGADSFVLTAELDTARLAEGFYFTVTEVRAREAVDNTAPVVEETGNRGDFNNFLKFGVVTNPEEAIPLSPQGSAALEDPEEEPLWILLEFGENASDAEGDLVTYVIKNEEGEAQGEGPARTAARINLNNVVAADGSGKLILSAIDEFGLESSNSTETQAKSFKPDAVGRVDIRPWRVPIGIGERRLFWTRTFDVNNNQVVGIDMEFSSSNPDIAVVSDDGEVTGVTVGEAIIEARTRNFLASEVVSEVENSGFGIGNALTEGDTRVVSAGAAIAVGAFASERPVVTIAGEVYFDEANDGDLESDPTVLGVRVLLLEDGVAIASQLTTDYDEGDGYSEYEFQLQPKDSTEYRIQIIAPPGFGFSEMDAAPDHIDSDVFSEGPDPGKSQVLNLSIPGYFVQVDAGLIQLFETYEEYQLFGGANAIGDFVWSDENKDGLQTGGEPGIPGTKVKLFSGITRQLLSEQYSGSDGSYRFENVPDGVFYIEAEPPDGKSYTNSARYLDNAKIDSDIVLGFYSNNTAGLATGLIVLNEGEANLDMDIGLVDEGAISGRIWLDTIENDFQDFKTLLGEGEDEPGLDEVQLDLYFGFQFDNEVALFDSTESSIIGGQFRFSGLPASNLWASFYIICYRNQPGIVVMPDVGEDHLDSDFSVPPVIGGQSQFYCTPKLTIDEPGVQLENIDGGFEAGSVPTQTGSVEIQVGDGEEVLENAHVRVCDVFDYCESGFTDKMGIFTAENLWHGEGRIYAACPFFAQLGYVPPDSEAKIIDIQRSDTAVGYIVCSNTTHISGLVWMDDGDGIFSVEPVFEESVAVQITIHVKHLDPEDPDKITPIAVTEFTDMTGRYSRSFEWDSDRASPITRVDVKVLNPDPETYVFTKQNSEGDATDSDVDANGEKHDVELVLIGSGDRERGVVDAGLKPKPIAAVGQLTIDFNADGMPTSCSINLEVEVTEVSTEIVVGGSECQGRDTSSDIGVYSTDQDKLFLKVYLPLTQIDESEFDFPVSDPAVPPAGTLIFVDSLHRFGGASITGVMCSYSENVQVEHCATYNDLDISINFSVPAPPP